MTNWEKEFHRWLGHERIRVFAVNSDHPLKHCPPQCPIVIMSYEMATRSEDALKKMRFDIIVCDEAHKIKNKNGQAYTVRHLEYYQLQFLTGSANVVKNYLFAVIVKNAMP